MYLLQPTLLYLYLCCTCHNPYPDLQSNYTESASQTVTLCECNGDICTSSSDCVATSCEDIIMNSDDLKDLILIDGHIEKVHLNSERYHNLTDRRKKEEEQRTLIWNTITVLLYVYFLCSPLRLSGNARDVTDIEVPTF